MLWPLNTFSLLDVLVLVKNINRSYKSFLVYKFGFTNDYFSFVLNKVFVAATKPSMKRNKNGFISYSPYYPSLNSREKVKQVLNFFSTLGLMPSIKNFKQNKRENIVQCWFYKISFGILRLISNASAQLLPICRQIPTLVQ